LIHNVLQGATKQHEKIVDKIAKHDYSLVRIPVTGRPVKMIGMPVNQLLSSNLTCLYCSVVERGENASWQRG
jgi:hypothetical protein